jgi:hypothetical protein
VRLASIHKLVPRIPQYQGTTGWRPTLAPAYTDPSLFGHLLINNRSPTLLAPFMVHHRDIVKFLEQIYHHASCSATLDLVNPTYSATYYRWKPELHFLVDILPMDSFADKLKRIQDLYFACKISKAHLSLSRKGEAGHFSLDGNSVEYWRRSWARRASNGIRVTLKYPISKKTSWKFLLLEDHLAREAICLPRHMVPSHLIGLREHRGTRDAKEWPEVEVDARLWAPFTFRMTSHFRTVTAIASIMRACGQGSDRTWDHALGELDSGYESSTPRRTHSGLGRWILDQLQ